MLGLSSNEQITCELKWVWTVQSVHTHTSDGCVCDMALGLNAELGNFQPLLLIEMLSYSLPLAPIPITKTNSKVHCNFIYFERNKKYNLFLSWHCISFAIFLLSRRQYENRSKNVLSIAKTLELQTKATQKRKSRCEQWNKYYYLELKLCAC